VICGRKRETLDEVARECAGLPGTALPLVCHVGRAAEIHNLVETTVRQFGRIDILVNNAAISQALRDVAETPTELWRSVIETNLTGTFLCTREALPLMGRGATIVNVLSLTVRSNPPKFAAYNASKMGVLGFTETLRTDLVSTGIRVTALMPGATDTAIWEQFWPDVPREGMVQVEDVAAAVLYAVTLPPQASVNEILLVPQKGLL